MSDPASDHSAGPESEHSQQDLGVAHKVRATNLERYGIEHPLRCSELVAHGIEPRLQDPEVIANAVAHEVEPVLQDPRVSTKVTATNLASYGIINPMKDPAIRSRLRR